MNHFLRDTILTFFICIAIILGIETCTRLLPSDNIYSFKYNYMENHASEIKTLLLGHSLFEESFNSNILGDSTFNLAICGRVSFYDVILLERYVDSMDNLKTVLFPIHYALDNPCNYYADRQGMESYVYHYYKYMKIRTPQKMYLYYLPKLTFQWENKHRGIMVGFESINASGYGKLPRCNDNTICPPEERRYTQSNPNFYCDNLKKIARICQEKGVRFIAVVPPSTNVYLSYTTAEGIRQLECIVDNIRKDYPIEYHNYLADSSFRADSLYHDSSHLNHLGATLFAQRVKEDFNL